MPNDGAPLPPDEVLEEEHEDEDEDDGSDHESDGEPVPAAVTLRDKRVNAGNRMRALLDDEILEVEEMFKDEEGDEEFEAKEEQDVFDSDFGSTDSGEGEEDEGEDAGERKLEREARAERREAKSKKKKVHMPFLPSFARQTKHARKDPVASTSATSLEDGGATPLGPPLKKRKISLAHTIAGLTPRESSRKSSVAFKKSIEVRLLESEQRRATLPKPVKKAAVTLTQADLIAEALETEEVNRASLLAFYAAEEDRRAADRIAGMRYELYGPRLTFLSRAEGVERKGKGQELAPEEEAKNNAEKLESGRRRLIEVIGEAGKQGWRPNMGMGDLAPGAAARGESLPSLSATSSAAVTELYEEAPSSSQVVAGILVPPPPKAPSVPPTPVASTSAPTTISSQDTPLASVLPAQHPPSSTAIVTPAAHLQPASPTQDSNNSPALPPVELHSRNYLILSDFEGTRAEEMAAIFGNHHEWGSVKVIPSRSRVLNRKVPTCSITGLPAPYRDPRTMTPYATISAYQTITRVINNAYVWNDILGAYTGVAGQGLLKEIEDAQRRNPAATAAAANAIAKGKSKAVAAVDQGNPYVQSYANGSGARAARRSRGSEGDLVPPSPSVVASGPVVGPTLSTSTSIQAPAPAMSTPVVPAPSLVPAPKPKPKPKAKPQPATPAPPAPTPALASAPEVKADVGEAARS